MCRQLQREIRRRREGERALGVLTSQLRQRSEAAEAANRELEAFSYSVSHDLRAPLRSVDGFSLALLEDYGRPARRAGALRTWSVFGMPRRGWRTSIDDLLQLSRVNRGELEREDVDVSALAERVVADRRRQDPTRSVAVTIRPGMTASADPRLLRVVLENLIENAWKFTARRERAEDRRGVSARRTKPRSTCGTTAPGSIRLRGQVVRRIPAPARGHRLSGDGHRAGDRAAHCPSPRRPRVGGGGVDAGARFSFTMEPPANEEQ